MSNQRSFGREVKVRANLTDKDIGILAEFKEAMEDRMVDGIVGAMAADADNPDMREFTEQQLKETLVNALYECDWVGVGLCSMLIRQYASLIDTDGKFA